VAVPKTNLTETSVKPVYFIHDVYRWKNDNGTWNSGMLLKYHDQKKFREEQSLNAAIDETLRKAAIEKAIIKTIEMAIEIEPVRKKDFNRGTNDEWVSKYGDIFRTENKEIRDTIVSSLVESGQLIEVKKGQTIFLEVPKNKGVEDDV
jgi:hypothetical protein